MFYDFVRFVAAERAGSAVDAGVDPLQDSFRGCGVSQQLTDKDVKEVLNRATASLLSANRKLHRGHVLVLARHDAPIEVVLKSAVRGVLQQRSIRAAANYRDKGAALMRERTAGLHVSPGAGAICHVRRHLAQQIKTASGFRATRLRVA